VFNDYTGTSLLERRALVTTQNLTSNSWTFSLEEKKSHFRTKRKQFFKSVFIFFETSVIVVFSKWVSLFFEALSSTFLSGVLNLA